LVIPWSFQDELEWHLSYPRQNGHSRVSLTRRSEEYWEKLAHDGDWKNIGIKILRGKVTLVKVN